MSNIQTSKSLTVKATQKVYGSYITYQKDGVKLNLSYFELQRLDFSTPTTLSALLNRYFTPLQSYEAIAPNLYGTDIGEPTGEVEYPLWQIRQAYLNTTQWSQSFDKVLETYSSPTVKSDEESAQAAVELAIANVLKHTLAHPQKGLNDYSEKDSNSLDVLIALVKQSTSHQQAAPHHADSLTYALSLLITLSLRDSTQGSLRRQILSFLKGEKVTFSFKVKSIIHTTAELTLSPKLIMRDLMFIDFRYTCWSGLNLDKIEFSGADFTGAFFVGSQNLTKARYCCFYEIHDRKLHLKESADLEGTCLTTMNESTPQRIVYFEALSYLLRSTLTSNNEEKNNTLNQALSLLEKTKASFNKNIIFKIHYVTIMIQLNMPRKALKVLFSIWLLDANATRTSFNLNSNCSLTYLNILGWGAINLESITSEIHLKFYTKLSNNVSTLRSTRLNYLHFVKALWPQNINVSLLKALQHIPDKMGYRLSEYYDYLTLEESLKALQNPKLTLSPKKSPILKNRTTQPVTERTTSNSSQKSIVNTSEPVKIKATMEWVTLNNKESISLHPDVLSTLFDSNGEFKSHTNGTTNTSKTHRHTIVRLQHRNYDIHLKLFPNFPAMDYAIDLFHRRLIGHGSIANLLCLLIVETEGKKPQRYPVHISTTVKGVDLETVITNKNKTLFEKIDKEKLAELFMLEILKCPGNGFSRNYIIEKKQVAINKEVETLTCINNYQSFVVSKNVSSRYSLFNNFKQTVNVRSILSCFQQFTTLEFPPPVIERFVDLDINKLFDFWLEDVCLQIEHNIKLFNIEELNLIFHPNSKRYFTLYLFFRQGLITELLQQTLYLQHLARASLNDKQSHTAAYFLEKLNPSLADFYNNQHKNNQTNCPEDIFKSITQNSNSPSFIEALNACGLEKITSKTELVNTNYLTPQEARDTIRTMHVGYVQELKNDAMETDYKSEPVQVSIAFEKLSKDEKEPQAGHHRQQKTINLYTGDSGTVFCKLKLENCVVLNYTILSKLLTASNTTLLSLELSGCREVTAENLQLLAEECSNLRHLRLISTSIDYKSSKELKLAFQALETFCLRDSDTSNNNVNHLSEVHLNSPKLTEISLNENQKLELVQIEAPNLVKLDISGAKELHTLKLEKTPPLEILNLNNCQALQDSKLYWKGTTLKELELKNCDKLTLATFRAKHPILFTALDWKDYPKIFAKQLTEKIQHLLKNYNISWKNCPSKLQHDIAEYFIHWEKSMRNEAIPALSKALKDDKKNKSSVRKAAVNLLQSCIFYSPKKITPILLDALNDSDKGVKQAVDSTFRDCIKKGFNDIVTPLLNSWENSNEGVRQDIMDYLVEFIKTNPEAIIDEFCTTLKHSDCDKHVKHAIVICFGISSQHCKLYVKKIIPALLNTFLGTSSSNSEQIIARCEKYIRHFISSAFNFISSAFNFISSAFNFVSSASNNDLEQTSFDALKLYAQHYLNDVVQILLVVMQKDDENLKRVAICILGICVQYQQCKLNIDNIIHGLLVQNENLKQIAIGVLTLCMKYHSSKLVPKLLFTLHTEDNLKQTVVTTIGACAKDLGSFTVEFIPELLIAYNDSDTKLKQAATHTLNEYAKNHLEGIIPLLLTTIKNPNDELKQAALDVLNKYAENHLKDIIPLLLTTIKNPNDELKQAALDVLNKYAENHLKNIIPLLLTTIKNPNDELKQAAIHTLNNFSEHFKPQIDTTYAQSTTQPHLIKRFCEAASRIASQCLGADGVQYTTGELTTCLNMLDNSDKYIKQSIANILSVFATNNPSYIEHNLTRWLYDLNGSDKKLKLTAIHALGAFAFYKAKDIIPNLLATLENNDKDIQQTTLISLGSCARLKSEIIIPKLLVTLKDVPDENVKRAAIQALEICCQYLKIDVTNIIKALLNCLKHPDQKVKQVAANTLGLYAKYHPSCKEIIFPELLATLKNIDKNIKKAAISAFENCAQYYPEYIIQTISTTFSEIHDNLCLSKSLQNLSFKNLIGGMLSIKKHINDKNHYNVSIKNAAVTTLSIWARRQIPYDSCEGIITPLLTALQTSEQDQATAAIALQACAAHQAIKPFVEKIIDALKVALYRTKQDVKILASAALGTYAKHHDFCADNVADTLFGKLETPLNNEVKKAMINALGDCAEHFKICYLSLLISQLKNPDKTVEQASILTLKKNAKHHQTKIASQLLTVLGNPRNKDKPDAIIALGICVVEFKPFVHEIIPILLTSLASSEKDVSSAAVFALDYYIENYLKEVILILLTHLSSSDNSLEQPAPKTLQRSVCKHQNKVISILLATLKDKNSDITLKLRAANALSICNQHLKPFVKEIIPTLLNILGETENIKKTTYAALVTACTKRDPNTVINSLLTELKVGNKAAKQIATDILLICVTCLEHNEITKVFRDLCETMSTIDIKDRPNFTIVIKACAQYLKTNINLFVGDLLDKLKDSADKSTQQVAASAFQICAEYIKPDYIRGVVPALKSTLGNAPKTYQLFNTPEYSSDEIKVRAAVINALGECVKYNKCYVSDTFKNFISSLSQTNSDEKEAAAMALATCLKHLKENQIREVIPILLTTLSGSENHVKQSITNTLVDYINSLPKVSIAILVKIISTKKELEQAAIYILNIYAQRFPKTIINELKLLAFSTGNLTTKEAAIIAIGACIQQFKSEDNKLLNKLLEEANQNPNKKVKLATIIALGVYAKQFPSCLECISPILANPENNTDKCIKQAAAAYLDICAKQPTSSLYQSNQDKVQKLLQAIKSSSDWRVKDYATTALGSYSKHLTFFTNSSTSVLVNAVIEKDSLNLRQADICALRKCMTIHTLTTALTKLFEDNFQITKKNSQIYSIESSEHFEPTF